MKDPRVDTYIENAKPFAKPILTHFRSLVHKACPDVEETIKWHSPFFVYKTGILCAISAFKEHATVMFWRPSMMEGLKELHIAEGHGSLGKLTKVEDLPSDTIMISLIKEAMEHSEHGWEK